MVQTPTVVLIALLFGIIGLIVGFGIGLNQDCKK